MTIDFENIKKAATRAHEMTNFLRDLQSADALSVRMTHNSREITFGTGPGHSGGPANEVRSLLTEHLKARIAHELGLIMCETQKVN